MALGGTLVVENFGYGVGDAELPLFENDEPLLDEDGQQKVMQFKILSIEPASGLRLEIRVAAAEWEGFLDQLAGKQSDIIKASVEDLRRLAAD